MRYTQVVVSYRLFPEGPRPYRAELAVGNGGPRKLVAACASAAAANRAADRAGAHHGLPVRHWEET